ncbi:MAG: DNA polymerase III subunit delta [Proteobacteria bacterium]|nr:DNA polymerase III subunit delta [Pseudomonadota bacterium]
MKASPKNPGKNASPARGGKPSLVYGIFGPDSYQREDFIKRLKKEILPENDSLNFESYPAGTGLSEILNAARTLPFGADRKLVLARDLEKLPAAEIPALEKYLANPSASTVLVLEGTKAPAGKLAALLTQAGELIKAESLKENQVPDWLLDRAREAGRSLSREAALAIADRVGTDLALAFQELEKVMIYTEARIIPAEAVWKTLSSGASGTIWSLFNEIGARNLPGALKTLNRLFAGGDHPIMILGQLAGRIRKLLLTRLLLDQGIAEAQIGKRLKINHPYALQCFCREARAYTQAEIRQGLRDLSELDLKLKRTGLSPYLLLEMYLVRFIPGKSARGPKPPVRN